jgi:hypothetical protein
MRKLLPKVRDDGDDKPRDPGQSESEYTQSGLCTYCGEFLVAQTGTTMANHQMHIACYYEMKSEVLNET